MKKTALCLALVLVLAGCHRDEKPVAGKPGASPAAKPATTTAATTTGAEIGAAMPEYSAVYLDGTKFELASKRDKVVLLNVWATWCGPCRFEIPELQRLHDAYTARGLEVVGVSVDESGPQAVKEFAEEQKMRYPIVLDAEGKLASVLQTSMLPTSVLVDRAGRIVWKRVGAIEQNDAELQQAIEKAL
jgi:thiol-disulfide isomerase/thioredoxin